MIAGRWVPYILPTCFFYYVEKEILHMGDLKISYTMTVDFARPSKSNTILIMKGDTGTREIDFVLMNNGVPLDVSEVSVVIVKAVNSTGAKIYDSTEVLRNEMGERINRVDYTIPAAIANVSGKTTLTLTLMAGENELSSWELYVLVGNELYDEDGEASDDTTAGFRALLSRMNAAVQRVENMSTVTELPNPNPFRLVIGKDQYTYNGAETVEVALGTMPFLGDTKYSTAEIKLGG